MSKDNKMSKDKKNILPKKRVPYCDVNAVSHSCCERQCYKFFIGAHFCKNPADLVTLKSCSPGFSGPCHLAEANRADVVVSPELWCWHCWKSANENEQRPDEWTRHCDASSLKSTRHWDASCHLFTDDSNLLSLSRQVVSISLAFERKFYKIPFASVCTLR